MNIWPGKPSTPSSALIKAIRYCSSLARSISRSSEGGPSSCRGSSKKMAPGPPAIASAYSASGLGAGVGGGAGVGVGGGIVAVGAGVAVGVGGAVGGGSVGAAVAVGGVGVAVGGTAVAVAGVAVGSGGVAVGVGDPQASAAAAPNAASSGMIFSSRFTI